MFNQQHNIGHELLDVPMGDMIQQMAFAIAEAQIKLDSNSIDVAQMMGGLKKITDDNGNVWFDDSRVFFGKEKLSLSSAIDLYNNTNDPGLKAAISSSQEISNNWQDPTITTAPTSVKTLSDLEGDTTVAKQNGTIYKVTPASGTPIYFRYTGSSQTGTAPFATTPSQYVVVTVVLKEKKPTAVERDVFIPSRVSMLELGFSPTFYQFIDTIIEVKISIKITQESASVVSTNTSASSNNLSVGVMGFPGFGGRAKVSRTAVSSHVNATYAQKYSYSAEGSSLLRTKLVPIPPPAILEERIRQNMELAKIESTTTTVPLPPPKTA